MTRAMKQLLSTRPCILISGHVGNWELIGFAISMLGFPMHAVYRPIDMKPLDEWVREARARRGLVLVSKFGAVKKMPEVLRAGQPMGLVADQSGGDRGIFVPFFGRLTSTYKSIGLLAMQTNARIVCGVARRVADGHTPDSASRWIPLERGEPWGSGPSQGLSYAVDIIDDFGPEDWEGQPDRLFYITARYRRAIETMIRRSPDQYLWMHRIWRSRPAHERLGKPFPGALRDKLLALPWMTQKDVDALVAQSDLDRASGNVGKRERE
jgi:KDO2-lipid IV(A) lauroyltransferase